MGRARVIRLGLAQPDTSAPAKKAGVVLGPGQRSILTRRGHLQRVPLPVVVEVAADPLAQVERHPLGMVDEQAQGRPGDDLGQQYLDLRLEACESGFDLSL